MEIPKLVYDDFYKFLMSFGVFLFTVSLVLGYLLTNFLILDYQWIFTILCILTFLSGVFIIKCAGKKWYENQQKLLDRKLKAETSLVELTVVEMIQPKNGSAPTAEIIGEAKVALVTYKVASELQDTVNFNFVKDGRVWFQIQNHEGKKYKAYITIKFISDGYEKEIDNGYYGGKVAWSLDAYFLIRAPGLDVPDKIKEKAKERKGVEMIILCKIEDENGRMVEEKFPVRYEYDYDKENWSYKP